MNEFDWVLRRAAHLYDVQLFALDAAEGGVRQRLFGAADERGGGRGFGQRAAVAGRVHHHGLGAGVDLRLHHGDLQDVGDGRFLRRRSAGAGLRLELDRRLAAAGHGRTLVMAAERDLGDGGALRYDWLLHLRHTERTSLSDNQNCNVRFIKQSF